MPPSRQKFIQSRGEPNLNRRRETAEASRERRLPSGQPDYRRGTFYALATAILLALQAPCAAPAARNLNSLDFMAFTQFALLLSVPLLVVGSESRRDFAAILLDVRKWPKLAAVFLVGATGLALFNIGLSSTHPIITAAILNLTPFWGALVAFVVSKRSMPIPPLIFAGYFAVAFCGAMAIAWSQMDVAGHVLALNVIESFLHSRWIYALPAPMFFTLGGTLVFKWFSEFDEPAAIAANFMVSSLVLIPVALVASDFGRQSHLSEQSAVAVLLLLFGTLASSAAGRVFYQLALTATHNDNGYVSMFFLLSPALTALVSFPLSHWIKELRFNSGPGFFFGTALVTAALLLLVSVSRQGAVSNSSVRVAMTR
jgi:drug/metabolite transporter (DMT)-like permease